MDNKRLHYHRNKLSQDSIDALEAVPGWSWGKTRAGRWTKGYKRLNKYFKRNGHTRVPVSYTSRDGFSLGQWVYYQRQRYHQKKLSPARIRMLEGIKFEWVAGIGPIKPSATRKVHEILWQKAFERLGEYTKQNNHALVKIRYKTAEGLNLGEWVAAQRAKYRRGKLSDEKIKSLENLPGWRWNVAGRQWPERFGRLRKFAALEGHPNVPERYVMPDGFCLGLWVHNQRTLYRSGKLSRQRIQALEKLPGWHWYWQDNRWLERYALLKEYVDREGHANVPETFSAPDGFGLGAWVNWQRKRYRKGKMPDWRVRMLEKINFVWQVRN